MAEAQKNTVLVVDDTPQNIEILGNILDKHYVVKIAPNGKRALAIAQSQRPDLILLDIMMPEMSGYEVCQELKNDDRTREIPVVFVTSRGEIEDEARGFELGAVDYIQKPVCPPLVLARIATHLLIHKQKKEIRDAYEELKDLEALRDNLVHMIVHDMRSPLMAIVGGLQLLSGKVDTESDAVRQCIDLSSSAASELNTMVTALLDISKMESGQLPLDRRTCDIKTIAASAIESMAAAAELEKVHVVLSAKSVELMADDGLIRRVFQNLINNAIKFSCADSTISMGISADEKLVKVTVEDKGPGIPEEYREKIFEKFGQVEAGRRRTKHSTGLGLTFCKLAIEAHGGQIGVDSSVGQGSVFWFTLPVQ